MAVWRKIKGLGLAAAVSFGALVSGAAWADYENALNAYRSANAEGITSEAMGSRVLQAMNIWQKSAEAGDVRSARALGDLFSDEDIFEGRQELKPSKTGVIPNDPVQALAWYTIAASHDFLAFEDTNPSPEEINARAYARLRLPLLRGQMTDAQVAQAEELVVNILSAGTQYDLERVGRMFAQGNGLPKDNVQALTYFYLARGNGRGANVAAAREVERLETILGSEEVKAASANADAWQPPRFRVSELSRAQENDAAELTDLEYQQLRAGLDKLETDFGAITRRAQEALRVLGYYWASTIDGDLTSKASRDAIRRFQGALFTEGLANPNEVSDDDKERRRQVQTGVLSDRQKVELMRRGAGREHPGSMHIYGVMLAEGIGVKTDGQQAIDLLTKAAEQDYTLAHYSAGYYYANGITAPKRLEPNLREACYHLSRAQILGYRDRDENLKKYCSFD
ncbi:MAG: tetratricopeptide repeat protein [Pseudomonadota bacterium]